MIADLKPYPAYKDSGVEWLGDVPEHWQMVPNRALMRLKKELVGSKSAEYLLLSLTKRGVVARDMENPEGKFPAQFDSYQVIEPGDLIFCLFDIDETPRAVGLSSLHGMITGAYTRVVCADETARRFAYLLYMALDNGKHLKPLYTGLRKVITKSTFLSAKMPLPSPPEQVAIVRFLDHADRRIRRYIRAKQKLSTLLEEQKQAIIHQAVTGQVDVRTGQPRPYKPSGVEWLRDVPEHWERARLKAFLLRPMRNGLFKKKDAFGSGAPLVNVADIYHDSFQIDPASLDRVQTTPDELRTYQVRTGDLFFVRSSLKLEGTGRSAVAIDCEAGSVFECHLVQGRPDPRRAVARFLAFQLNSFSLRHYMISRANVVTMATVSQGVLASCPVFLPSISEQEGLLKQIDGECARVAATHDRAHREIDLLREYHTRLIADVVTGKLDVRETAAGLPDEVEELEPLDEAEVIINGEEEPSDGLDTTPEEATV